MKTFIFILIILYCTSKKYIINKVFDIKFQEEKKVNESEAGLCLNLDDIKKDDKFYIQLQSKEGSINKTLVYEFLNNSCYENYTYDSENSLLTPIETSDSSEYKTEFSNEYEFTKNTNLNYIFVIYTEYTGNELTIYFSQIKVKTVLYIVLGCIAGFVVLLIICCFCCYKCSKRKQKKIIQNEYQSNLSGPLVYY